MIKFCKYGSFKLKFYFVDVTYGYSVILMNIFILANEALTSVSLTLPVPDIPEWSLNSIYLVSINFNYTRLQAYLLKRIKQIHVL